MKMWSLIFYFAVLLCLSCDSKPEWKIEFCETLVAGDCSEPNDTFERNVRIYVTLERSLPIQQKMIVGNIYRMLNGEYDDYLGTNNFAIGPNTTKIDHYIPFDEMGGAGPHLIEFTEEDGTLIINKELFIR